MGYEALWHHDALAPRLYEAFAEDQAPVPRVAARDPVAGHGPSARWASCPMESISLPLSRLLGLGCSAADPIAWALYCLARGYTG
ncbi:hypothetical protein PABY_00760 [Pyrodictium abyssi]|uniref:Uncharacterized protein n=1 Tax=Pyrodictium abyssi TaxID=54256 RepID=A0ABM8ISG4_9CREN|nr:hypothetical protein PABY_00760 [Pyrodictium abyssi]